MTPREPIQRARLSLLLVCVLVNGTSCATRPPPQPLIEAPPVVVHECPDPTYLHPAEQIQARDDSAGALLDAYIQQWGEIEAVNKNLAALREWEKGTCSKQPSSASSR
jgi:hypothetical protein